MALKAVWRGSRFKCAATQYVNSAVLDDGSDGIDLLFTFDGAWAGHHHHIASADFDLTPFWTNLDGCAFGLEGAARTLIRRGDLNDLPYAIQNFNVGGIHRLHADDAPYRASG